MLKKALLLTAVFLGFADFAVAKKAPHVEAVAEEGTVAATPVASEADASVVPVIPVPGDSAAVIVPEKHADKAKKKSHSKKKARKAHAKARHHARKGHARSHACGDKISDELNKASADRTQPHVMSCAPSSMPIHHKQAVVSTKVVTETMENQAILDTEKSILNAKKELNDMKSSVVS